jgi:hypothetical protein
MEAFNKLFKYLGIGGAIALILFTLVLVFLIGPAILLWGLNLMGFEVEYTIGTFFGASLIIIALRAGSGTRSKK